MNQTILAIELSTPAASIALWKDGALSIKKNWLTDRDHTEIFSQLGEVLPAGQKNKIDLILVGAGPGSYGGVRVALASADGISLALGSTTAAICSWEAIVPPDHEAVYIIANARRNGWVTGLIQNGSLQGELVIIPTEDMPAWIAEKVKEGRQILSIETQENVDKEGFSHVKGGAAPQADKLIMSWLAKTDEERRAILDTPPSPIYVRPPNITPAKAPSWFVRTKF